MVQGKLEARLRYKGNLKHGYGTRETWSTRLVHGYTVQGKLKTWLQYKGNMKHG